MIKFLRIRNLATIQEIRLDLNEGFTILTGETGAGKSIIIDSIRLVCGERASPDLIRTGCSEASVESVFSLPPQPELSEGRTADEREEGLIVQRTVSGDGSGKAYCNGDLIPVKKLRELAGDLVDIYGQNDHVFLLRLDSHLDYLDRFGGTLALRGDVARAAQELRRLLRLKEEWKARERDRTQRLDFLEFQIREIEKADLKVGEEEELRAERHILRNAEKIRTLVERALDISYTGETSIAGLLPRLQSTLAELATFDPSFSDARESLSSLEIVVRELSDVLIRAKDKQEAGPEKLEALEERLSLIESLKRKYGNEIKDIQFYLATIKTERQELERIQEKLASVEGEIRTALAEYSSKAQALSQARIKASRALEGLIEKEIGLLGMKKARFRVQIDSAPVTSPDAERVRDAGIDDVEFLISPNPGEEPKPLRKIASGGELSRIMLALKALGKERDELKTLIFDEIDSGIGGKTAEFIAQKLEGLSRSHQIICITHLPQIASFAAHHFRIEKKVERNRTFTSVKKLTFEDRVEEIARLMAGSRITAASLESAREMLLQNLGKKGREADRPAQEGKR
jgi:DNA repair protein RecN (Recombination protein N)